MNPNRVPRGVSQGGQWAQSARPETGVTLGGVRPFADHTPAEVDTELARLYDAHGREMTRYSQAMDYVSGEVGRHLGRGWGGKAKRDEIEARVAELRSAERLHPNDRTMLDQYDRAQNHLAAARALENEMGPLNDEFDARGGWTRAFLVSNSNGHVHKDMHCSTCFEPGWDYSGNYREGTRYHWVTDLSGADEAEVVEAAGERACTVCYPSAPVATLSRPTTLFTPDEVAKADARAAREAAKIEKEKSRIAKAATADGSELVVDTGHSFPERFKTERAASIWAVDRIVMTQYWPGDPVSDEASRRGIDVVVASLAEKRGVDPGVVRAEFEKKAAAKAKREGLV